MSQISPEVKAAIYTYVTCKIAWERQEEEISNSTQTTGLSSSSIINNENLTSLLLTNFYDNLLIVYSQEHSIASTTSGTQLNIITEEVEEEWTSTPTNETYERQKFSEEAEEEGMKTPTNRSYERQEQTIILQTVREPGIRTDIGGENRKIKHRNRRTQPYRSS